MSNLENEQTVIGLNNEDADSVSIEQPEYKTELWNLRARHNTSGLSDRKLRVAVTFVAVTGFSLFGYDQGLMSGLLGGDQFQDEFPGTKGDSQHASVIQGALTSCYEIGCFFGALFALFRGEHIGRRPLVLAGSLIIVIGTIISVSSFKEHWGTGQFVIGRVITGMGNGLNTATIPVWQSEMSRPEVRGRLVTLEGAVVAVGTLVAYWVDFGLSYTHTSVQWRFPVALQILFALCVFFGMLGLPDSPRWLIARGRISEARHILGKLKGLPADDDEIVAEASVIADAVNRFDNAQLSFKEIIQDKKHQYVPRMIIGASTQFFQQFTGCNAAIYYATVLFENSMHLERRLSLILGGVFAVVYALFTIPSFFLVDKLGRRPLFLIGAAGQGVAFIIAMGCLVHNTSENAKGAVVGLFLFIAFFAFTILPLPWVYPPEINPLRTRTVGTGFSTCTNWLCNFAVVMFTPIFIEKSSWGCYLFFAIINFAWLPVIYMFYPETAGRSLEEVDIIFARAKEQGALPFRVAQMMEKMNFKQVEEEAVRLGLYEDEDFKAGAELKENEGSLMKNDEDETSSANSRLTNSNPV